MSTEFKKGSPHGPAVLQLATNTTQPRTVWAGTFWNGAVAEQQEMDPDIRQMFDASLTISTLPLSATKTYIN